MALSRKEAQIRPSCWRLCRNAYNVTRRLAPARSCDSDLDGGVRLPPRRSVGQGLRDARHQCRQLAGDQRQAIAGRERGGLAVDPGRGARDLACLG